MKGPDNSTSQLLPTSSQRKVKMGWERFEKGKRRWHVQEMHVEERRAKVFRIKNVVGEKKCVKVWCVKVVRVCVDFSLVLEGLE